MKVMKNFFLAMTLLIAAGAQAQWYKFGFGSAPHFEDSVRAKVEVVRAEARRVSANRFSRAALDALVRAKIDYIRFGRANAIEMERLLASDKLDSYLWNADVEVEAAIRFIDPHLLNAVVRDNGYDNWSDLGTLYDDAWSEKHWKGNKRIGHGPKFGRDRKGKPAPKPAPDPRPMPKADMPPRPAHNPAPAPVKPAPAPAKPAPAPVKPAPAPHPGPAPVHGKPAPMPPKPGQPHK